MLKLIIIHVEVNQYLRVSEAYVAGINFQANQTKQGGKK